jgi:hypothetical protein
MYWNSVHTQIFNNWPKSNDFHIEFKLIIAAFNPYNNEIVWNRWWNFTLHLNHCGWIRFYSVIILIIVIYDHQLSLVLIVIIVLKQSNVFNIKSNSSNSIFTNSINLINNNDTMDINSNDNSPLNIKILYYIMLINIWTWYITIIFLYLNI